MPSSLDPVQRRQAAERFATRLIERGIEVPSVQALEPVVEAILARARTAWPDWRVDTGAFVAHVGTHWVSGPEGLEGTAQALVVEDLYLAFACSTHEPRALQAFERTYADELAKATAKLRGNASIEDARQRVWQRLFVGAEGTAPKILDYSGRGQLRHWYRVTIVRTLLDQLRRPEDRAMLADEDRVLGIASQQVDPETEYLKRLYRHEFQSAFETAVQALSPEDRNVLRAYYVQELTIDQIAAVFGVHRATAARRVERARTTLLGDTRRCLSERLKLSNKEIESVIRLIESQLHVSIGKLLT